MEESNGFSKKYIPAIIAAGVLVVLCSQTSLFDRKSKTLEDIPAQQSIEEPNETRVYDVKKDLLTSNSSYFNE